MNTFDVKQNYAVKLFAAAAIAALLLVNCASTPQSPPGAADVRARLTGLQSNPYLGIHAPAEIKEAEAAVRLAEVPVPRDRALGAHRVQMAEYAVQLAESKASTRYAEHQRIELSESREHARLRARTREADLAREQAGIARLDASRARDDADAARASEAAATSRAARQAELARNDSERARLAAAAEATRQARLAESEADQASALAAADAANAARQVEAAHNEADKARNAADKARTLAEADAAGAAMQKAELQRQIDLLEAKTTDRGLVLTLSNVLFATGMADLIAGSTNTLDKLVSFLNQYPDRNVLIEGHTDNVGTSSSNQALSQRRAESVKSYLVQKGIGAQRLSASGLGEDQPVAGNESATGRQQNRRVEIIIDNPPQVAAAMTADK